MAWDPWKSVGYIGPMRLEPGISHSYHPEFVVGELVELPDGRIGIVHPSSSYERIDQHNADSPYHMVYRIKVGVAPGESEMVELIGEGHLEDIGWNDYIWFRNPETGRMNMGKTRGWMAAIIHLFGGILFGCGFSVIGPWKIAPFLLGAGTIGLLWFGTWMNFKKKWL